MINYNPNDKQKALELANSLTFEEKNITDIFALFSDNNFLSKLIL